MKAGEKKTTLFFVGGIGDIDIATNQSLKNTIKFLSQFGFRIHFFGALPSHYRILQDPKKVFSDQVTFHRSPDFLTPIFDFGKLLKDMFGLSRKKNDEKIQTLKATQKIRYYDEYNFLGRLLYIAFLFMYAPFEIIRVSYYCFKLKPDLIYGMNGQGGSIAVLVAQLFRKPMLQRWHGCSLTEEDLERIRTRVKDKILLLDGSFTKWLPSDAVIMTNDGTQGEKLFRLIGVPPEKIHFWMNGMDVDDMTLPEAWDSEKFKQSLGLSGKRILMTASRLVLWKRVDRAVDCLYRLVKEQGMTDVVLLVLGQGPEKENLQALAKQLGVDAHLKIAGAVPHEDISKYYSIADVFLNLYDISNLGNPLLEAMYWGLPIASIDDGSTEELLQDGQNAFLSKHEKLDTEFPLKVKRLLDEPALRKTLGANVKKTFDQKVMSWEDRMRMEYDMINQLIARKTGRTPAASRQESAGIV